MIPGDRLNAFTRSNDGRYHSGPSPLRIAVATGGTPRLNHYQKGRRTLLVEAGTVNLLLRSADPANAAWTKDDLTVDSALPVNAPDGTLVSRLVETAVNSAHEIFQTVAISDGAPVAVSGYFRARERFRCLVSVSDALGGGSAISVDFRTDTAILGTPGASGGAAVVRAYVDDSFASMGWYRIVLVGTQAAGVTSVAAVFRILDDSGTSVYTGDTSKSAYWWGMQAENAVFVGSSYVPTLGAAVGRSADSANISVPFGPQPFWVYHRFIELGAVFTPDARAWHLGTTTAPCIFLYRSGSNVYGVRHHNGVVATEVALGASPAMLDEVEVLVIVNEHGRPDLYQSLNRAAVSSVVGGGTNIGFPTAWGSNLLWIGSDNGTTHGYAAHERLVIGRGTNITLHRARGIAG